MSDHDRPAPTTAFWTASDFIGTPGHAGAHIWRKAPSLTERLAEVADDDGLERARALCDDMLPAT